MLYYPPAGTLQATTDHLVATTNSQHVIGASASPTLATGPQLTDSDIVIPTGGCPLTTGTAGVQPTTTGLTIQNTANQAFPLTNYGIANINQVIASPNSALAMVTYSSNATCDPGGRSLAAGVHHSSDGSCRNPDGSATVGYGDRADRGYFQS